MTSRPEMPKGMRAGMRILATTDLHMHLLGHDYYADRPDPSVGLSRTATLIQEARQEALEQSRLVCLFDNGDAFQGTPLSDFAAGESNGTHPLMKAFSYLRYDAMGLGNHDFNFGLAPLSRALRRAPCPVLSTNMRQTDPDAPPLFKPYAILDRQLRNGDAVWPIRIGLMSFLPPQTIVWDSHHLKGRMEIDGIVKSAQRWLPDLKAQNCDLVIALAHTGLSNQADHTGLENAAVPLAALAGIDVVISGHTHLRLPGPDHLGLHNVDAQTGTVHGKPMVMAGTAGTDLGVIDIDLITNRQNRWDIHGFRCNLRPIATRTETGASTALVPEDPALVRLLDTVHNRTRKAMQQPVGFSNEPLHSYFSFVAPDRSLALVAAAQAAALRRVIAGTDLQTLPLVSATAPGKFGGRAGPDYYTDIPAGPLSIRNIADLQIFPNELRAKILSGAQIRDWLELSARLFNRIEPGTRGQPLLNDAIPGHDFDVLHGLTYEIDLSAPSAQNRSEPDSRPRITNIRHAGAPLRPDDRFVVALNNYRAVAGGAFSMLAEAETIPVPTINLKDAIRNYVSGAYPQDPLGDAPPPWHFTPLPDTRVITRTGPRAMIHLGELESRDARPLGLDKDGFLELDIVI